MRAKSAKSLYRAIRRQEPLQGYSLVGLLSAISEAKYRFADLPATIPYNEHIEAKAREKYIQWLDVAYKGIWGEEDLDR